MVEERQGRRLSSGFVVGAAVALLAALVLAAPAEAKSKTKTKTALNTTATPIVAGGVVESSVQFPKKGKIKDINVIIRADVNTSEVGFSIFDAVIGNQVIMWTTGTGAAGPPGVGTGFGEGGSCDPATATIIDDERQAGRRQRPTVHRTHSDDRRRHCAEGDLRRSGLEEHLHAPGRDLLGRDHRRDPEVLGRRGHLQEEEKEVGPQGPGPPTGP